MIRRLREERGATRLELASRLRVTQVRQLARLFEVSMDDIKLEGEDLRNEAAAPLPPDGARGGE